MAMGDFTKETWVSGSAPGINAPRLQTRDDKLYEIDQLLAALGIDDTVGPTGDTAALSVLVSWFAHMFKSLSGKPNWRTDPSKSLEDLKNALIDPGSAERGDVFYTGASGLARLAHGAVGQMLVSGGHGADPRWGSVMGCLLGTGADGDVTISDDTTLTADVFYDNLTVNNGVTLNTGGYRVFVRGTLTNNGTIQRNGNDGGNGTSGAVGSGGAALTTTMLGGSTAGGGAGGGPGGNISYAYGGAGGKGGTGDGAGSNGGSVSAPPVTSFQLSELVYLLLMRTSEPGSSIYHIYGGSGGGSGDTSAGCCGGGGGSGGGVVWIACNELVNNGTISADGGNGGNGYTGGGGASGGGAGGGGGLVVLIYGSKSVAGTIQAAGGSGGAKGGGGISTDGASGSAGTVLEYVLL